MKCSGASISMLWTCIFYHLVTHKDGMAPLFQQACSFLCMRTGRCRERGNKCCQCQSELHLTYVLLDLPEISANSGFQQCRLKLAGSFSCLHLYLLCRSNLDSKTMGSSGWGSVVWGGGGGRRGAGFRKQWKGMERESKNTTEGLWSYFALACIFISTEAVRTKDKGGQVGMCVCVWGGGGGGGGGVMGQEHQRGSGKLFCSGLHLYFSRTCQDPRTMGTRLGCVWRGEGGRGVTGPRTPERERGFPEGRESGKLFCQSCKYDCLNCWNIKTSDSFAILAFTDKKKSSTQPWDK